MLFDNVLKKLKLLPWLLIIVFSGYFAWNDYYGQAGYERLQELRAEYKKTLAESKRIAKERDALSRKVKNLYSWNIDSDLLDETARRVLNFADDGDIIIFD